MKKSTFYLMMIVLSLSMFPNTSIASEKNTVAIENKVMPLEVKVMLNRLEEIKAMDKSEMKYSEKRELRKEVRSINTALRSSNGGVYLSVGAIIIIILLLIILL
ncbi:hypothetical protein [Flavobacterium cellulosilyticum]|uniref:Seryl-tRNA synthetase n=1 Tax=Flavobacterium cellulosilyticum TaxID=2541731 RepID=A0A4R5CEE3_9FLAO|nr:hypothetical protein [Flavobacterium cellulosilyticum]TDD98428.1 hypothetical protein E0F76_04635 [Flavobacterium cellulosilyticum]